MKITKVPAVFATRTTALIAVLIALFMLPLTAVATAANPDTTNCAFDKNTQFKYEVDEDKWEPSDPGFDLIVVSTNDEGEVTKYAAPEGWEITCQKAPTNNGVSHVVIQVATTDTTQPEEDTTTTTTSIPETSTTNVEESTTTTNQEEETTSTSPSTEGTEGESEEETEEDGETLPFTGVDNPLALIGLALTLMASGGLLIRRQHS